MKIELRIERREYIDIPEADAQRLIAEVEKQERTNKDFKFLRYHEKLESVYEELYGIPFAENNDETLSDWFIQDYDPAHIFKISDNSL
ncbi:MAG: hypothetical protein IKE95_00910 [Methanobrevibacter sp.]|nr:hypothetical protein [Methanobrevibacter sp.]